MKRGTKTRRGREFWEVALGAQVQSGLSVADYCAEKGLEQVTFYAWRKRLLGKDNPPEGILFTPITVKESPLIGSEVLLPGGLVLRFSGLAPVDYLRQLSAAYVVL
jgi:hypothetical protein